MKRAVNTEKVQDKAIYAYSLIMGCMGDELVE